MMEVARNGLINPEHFNFAEIMLIFVAVMITDVILLDVFNTYGMPTSTSISIIFELLGASIAIGIFKIIEHAEYSNIAQLINLKTTTHIFTGIFLSIFISIFSGLIIQFFSRLAFTFNLQLRMKYLGAVYGGIALTAIIYFILVNGLGGSTYADVVIIKAGEPYMGVLSCKAISLSQYAKDMSWQINIISFLIWTSILQLLMWLSKIDILKTTVFIGTFALAMAFASNDLVNFIGVPMAGYESYVDYISQVKLNPNNFLMESLNHPFKSPATILVVSGLVMVITLWTSKKAKTVVKTSLDLARQEEGEQKFSTNALARGIYRQALRLNIVLEKYIPSRIQAFVRKQFSNTQKQTKGSTSGKEVPAFDMLRASVNLVVASIIIATGTANTIPLSTTYVTFLVLIGTSLADNAWGRDSAVYRISGVIWVVSGWLMTAFIAFASAFGMAVLFHFTGVYGIFGMSIFTVIIFYFTHIIHKKNKGAKDKFAIQQELLEQIGVFESCNNKIISTLEFIKTETENILNALDTYDRKLILTSKNHIREITNETKLLKKNVHLTLSKTNKETVHYGLYYVQVVDHLRELVHSLDYIVQPAYEHIENNHIKLSKQEREDLLELNQYLNEFIKGLTKEINLRKYLQVEELIEEQQQILDFIQHIRQNQVDRICTNSTKSKSSLLVFGIVHEYNNIVLQLINLLKSQSNFNK
jgi:phosphate/sulfate permease